MEQTNTVFQIDKLDHHDNLVNAVLSINAESEILKGHFPGQPVIPGACMLQSVKNVLENVLKTSLRLKIADQLKFIAMIIPDDDHVIMDLSYKTAEEGGIKACGKISKGEVVYFKFQVLFV